LLTESIKLDNFFDFLLSRRITFSEDVISKYIQLEEMQVPPSVQRALKIHQHAIKQFPSSKNIWLSAYQFALKHGEVKRANEILRDAQLALKDPSFPS